MDRDKLSQQIKLQGEQLGFDLVGISRAEFLEQEAHDLEQWLKEERHGNMQYMENYFDKRVDPRLLVPGAKSVISVIHNYLPPATYRQPEGAPKISVYAWGEDYHKVLKRKLYRLLEWIQTEVGEVAARVFVDSAPVMDKAWAQRSGLGWIGKHTNLITPKKGSYFFIGEIILDVDLVYDGPVNDYCGTCTRCLDACPTDALTPYQIDASRCISYLTIELKEEIPDEFHQNMEGWAYGCDICQEVCPWNRHARAITGEDFRPLDHILNYSQDDWLELEERTFKKLTKKTAMNRVKWNKMKGNLQVIVPSPPPQDAGEDSDK
ncbi:MAG: tRNA epoxyqueuosine(34) reductase QueG [Bacteroidota bacterium]